MSYCLSPSIDIGNFQSTYAWQVSGGSKVLPFDSNFGNFNVGDLFQMNFESLVIPTKWVERKFPKILG